MTLTTGRTTLPTLHREESVHPRPLWRALVLLGAVGGVVLVLALLVGGGRPQEATTGLGSAGAVTSWAAQLASMLTRLLAIGTVGMLLYALLHPRSGPLRSDGVLRSLRQAGALAGLWAGAALLEAYLNLAVLVGLPLGTVPGEAVVSYLNLPVGQTALGSGLLLTAVALLLRRDRTQLQSGLILAGALTALLLPVVFAGHSAGAENHWLAITSISLHVVAATLWVGGLVGLVAHGRTSPALSVVAYRYSAVALGCFLLTGITGVISAGAILGGVPTAGILLGTGYGLLLVAKTLGLLVLGGFGWWHRRETLPQLRANRKGPFWRFAGVEIVVMVAVSALGVALSLTPAEENEVPLTTQVESGPAAGTAAPGADEPVVAEVTPEELRASSDMTTHDHGDLSVGILIDPERFHVARSVPPGSDVTLFNNSGQDVTLTAQDGTFDVRVPKGALFSFPAPAEAGNYRFASQHDPSYQDILVVE